LLGGSGRGNQWLGARSLPVHPVGIVSSRQRETRTVPVVPSCASNMRMLVPSFGAVLIGCHFGNMAPNPHDLVPRQLQRRRCHVVPVHSSPPIPGDLMSPRCVVLVRSKSRSGRRLRASAFRDGEIVESYPQTIPACRISLILFSPRPLRGVSRGVVRRDQVRCPCGLGLRKSSTRGGAGLPPGPLRGPARSWLTTVGSVPNAGDRLSCLWMRRAEPQQDKGSRRDTYGESGAGAG
jgi:hypothetical protein